MKSIQIKITLACCFCLNIFISSLAIANTTPSNNPNSKEETPVTNTIFKTLNQQEILTVTIKTNIDSILMNKNTEKSFPAKLSYTDVTGVNLTRKIKVKARGRSRRKVCDFPPLKIKFCKKELAADNISKSHKSLKLITHCNDESGSLQNVIEEYLAYKVYNELTNSSLKVQLIKINYEDMDSDDSFKRYAVLIEDIDELAERIGGKEVEGFGKTLADFDQTAMNTFATFQFMIGNEDWRVPFMRNIKFVQQEGNEKLTPIPYDFDASGLVFAKYAKPDRDLKLQSVRQRAFMGEFNNKEDRAAMVDLFNAKKEGIYDLIQNFKVMNKVDKAKTIAYFDSFYEIINTPKLLRAVMPLKGKMAIPTDINGAL